MRILFDDVIDMMYVVAMYRTFILVSRHQSSREMYRAFLSFIMLFISIALLLSCSGCPLVKERGSQKGGQQQTTRSEPMTPTWEVAD